MPSGGVCVDTFSESRIASSLRIDPRHTAVVVVDMLNDFCTEGGAMVLPGAERLYAPQNALMARYRDAGCPILFIVDSHRPGLRRDREFLKRTPHCIEGSWGAEIVSALERRPQDMTIVKRRYSAFFNTDLDLTLRDMDIETLVVMGVVTNICVRSTVHDGFFLGYRIAVPYDCCAATGPREQASSLYDIATHFGVVSNAASLVEALGNGLPVENLRQFETS
jgi:ureidoacrylate peracid hydrolase